ncbi:MAG: GHKL domain-containing protein, partial [Bacteroidetes bacterium]|nr:GHKL domain-containing protein [Bacteroidota bacterium]
IELKHWQKNLGFDFVALHYLRSEDNLYSWKLENHDNNWSAPSKERKATYTNLSPGRYIFRVKASNADGVWNEEGTSLSIRIFPPWWLSWWAYGLYLILFIAGIWAVYRVQISRVKQKEREKAREKELEQAKEIEKAYENLKATQEQLVQQEKLASLGQLTAGIAHEIKNPLNFVNNFSEVSDEMIEELIEALNKGDIEESLALSKDIGANLKKIHEHGSRANGIVQSMLMHSRGGSGKMEPTDLNALIKEYVNLSFHGMRAGKEAIEVDIDLQLDENVGEVPLVAEDFSRVILNLCNNAFDAMRSKLIEKERAESGETYHPKLTVRTKSENGQVLIEIEDNGPGIPDEIKDKIMQPFFTTKKGTQGTGLGLSITNDIIKAHGGSLDIESSAKGSTFIIYIPK